MIQSTDYGQALFRNLRIIFEARKFSNNTVGEELAGGRTCMAAHLLGRRSRFSGT